MVDRPTPGSDMEPASQYLLGHPLPLLQLSKIRLSAHELKAIRQVRLAQMRERHRKYLDRMGNWVQQEEHHALREQGRKHILRLTESYKQQEAEKWVPSCSTPDGSGGVTFDPVKFDPLGRNLEGYLRHVPSLFSVEWAGNGGLTETLPRFSHRTVSRDKTVHDQRVLLRQQILNDAVFKEWIFEIYVIFCDWFPMTSRGRPAIRLTPVPGRPARRVKPKQYTLQVVNHYIPGLSLTEGYVDELLKPIIKGEPKPDSVQTAPALLPDESTTNLTQHQALIDKTEELVRKKNRARTAHRMTT